MALAIFRLATLLHATLILGCSSAPSAPELVYMERGHAAWLTRDQSEHVLCRDGGLLLCRGEIGRLSMVWCECPP
jgi:hypothetical protein